MNHHEVFVSARDAEALAATLGSYRRANPFESDASDELAGLLLEARMAATETLPADRVAMNSTVTYIEEPAGARRTVTLAFPHAANAAEGRISVLSPIGLALIGRRRGAMVTPALPNGREVRIRIVETHAEREAA